MESERFVDKEERCVSVEVGWGGDGKRRGDRRDGGEKRVDKGR